MVRSYPAPTLLRGVLAAAALFAAASAIAGPMTRVSTGSRPATASWAAMVRSGVVAPVQAPGSDVWSRLNRASGGDEGLFLAPPASPGKGVRPLSPQDVGTGFPGVDRRKSGTEPPDSVGAMGPAHYLQLVNCLASVYDRSGAQVGSSVSLAAFFAADGGYPHNGIGNPRVIYDRLTSRFFAAALEFGDPYGANNQVLLAVSRTSDPTGSWDRYVIPVGEKTGLSDYPTLGVDAEGVYVGITIVGASSVYTRIAATAKAPLVAASPSLGSVWVSADITDMYGTPVPAVNMDAAPVGGRAWFAASSTATYGNFTVRSLTWSGGSPTLGDMVTVSTPTYGAAAQQFAPALGSTHPIYTGDDRIQSATLHRDRLWACRSVSLNVSGGGDHSDRLGVEWLSVAVPTATPVLAQNGRVYDAGVTNPHSYYCPSIMVTGQGHTALAFCGSSTVEHVGVYTCGRLAGDPSGAMQSITQVVPGLASYDVLVGATNRWGHYGGIGLDPNDDMTVWSTQEFAADTSVWGTWITPLRAPAPTVASPGGSALQNTAGVSLDVTGSGFFDPGPGFASRPTAHLTGGAVNGIGNVTVTVLSSTSARITFDVADPATPGARDVVFTNPDGRSATAVAGFTVLEKTRTATRLSSPDRTGVIADTIALKGFLYVDATSAPLAGRTLSFAVAGTHVGDAVTDAAGAAALLWTITDGPATRTITASFGYDPVYRAVTTTAKLTALSYATKVYVIDRTAKIKTYTVLKAYLYLLNNTPVGGKLMAIKVDGTLVGTDTTRAAGYAQLGYTVALGAGSGIRVISGEWAGNGGYLASANTGKLTANKADIYIWTYVRSAKRGTGHPLRAYVRSLPDYVILPGKSITFSVNGTEVGTGVVGADGWANVVWAMPADEPLGAHTARAAFAGDAWFVAGAGTLSFNVVP
ncbi:MAG: hypothetical protein NT029_12075 [Armatimonadetes bacterium]|nr:hypothetical protein [Armatimonadota bacterium]